jgi:hypothetical protein
VGPRASLDTAVAKRRFLGPPFFTGLLLKRKKVIIHFAQQQFRRELLTLLLLLLPFHLVDFPDVTRNGRHNSASNCTKHEDFMVTFCSEVRNEDT